MSTQFNYYYQNFSSERINPLAQNTFNSIGTKNGLNIYNNLNNLNNNMNENYNIIKKNSEIANSNNNNSNQKIDIDKKSKYINEKSPILSKENILKILNQLNNNICIIYNSNNISATRFFCKIPFFNSTLPVLITTSYILKKDDIKVNRIIKIALIKNEKEREISIVINEPRITFTDGKLGITIIEIIPKIDGINDFLEVP